MPAVGSVNGPSRGRGATGEKRRFRPFAGSQWEPRGSTLKNTSWAPADRWVDREAVIRTRLVDTPTAGSSQLVEQPLRFFQIGDVEPFGKPTVDPREQVAGFRASALVSPQSREAHGGAQFPELGLLLLGDTQGFAVQFLNRLGTPAPQQQPTFQPVQLRCEPALPCLFDDLQGI